MSANGGGRRAAQAVAAGVVGLAGLVVTGAGVGLVVVLLALLTGSVGPLPWVLTAVGVAGSAVAAGLAWVAVGWASDALAERAARWQVAAYERARSVEDAVPPARRLGLAALFEPDEERLVAELRRRYVDGRLDEAAFERALADLLGADRAAAWADRAWGDDGVATPDDAARGRDRERERATGHERSGERERV